MENKKISELDLLENPSLSDFLEILDVSETDPSKKNKKSTLQTLKDLLQSSPAAYFTRTGIANQTIPAQRAVMAKGGKLYIYDPSNEENYGRYVGISVNSAVIGEEVTYVYSGLYTVDDTFGANMILFASSGGTGILTNVAPNEGVYQEIAYALSDHLLLIRTGQPKLFNDQEIEFTQAEKNKLQELSDYRKDPVANTEELKEIPQEECSHGDDRLVVNENGYYRFDENSTTGIRPNIKTGTSGAWVPIGLPFNGQRAITTIPKVGDNLGSLTMNEFLEKAFFGDIAPEAEFWIEGGSVKEFTGDETILINFKYSIKRKTNPINVVEIEGNRIIGPWVTDVEGSFPATVPSNINAEYTLTAEDSTGLTDTETVSLEYQNGFYWGPIAKDGINDPITDEDILSLNKELRTNRLKSLSGIDGNGNHLAFGFPSEMGTPQFIVNGLPNSAYTKVRDNAFINSLGYSKQYQVWVSNTVQFGATNMEIK